MKKLYKILCVLVLSLLWYACNSNDNEPVPVVKSLASGTMKDARDGYVYHWARYGGLDWTVENSHYNTNDKNCSIYTMSTSLSSSDSSDSTILKKFGYLYNYKGALEAAPTGWRVPTDEDWKKLEEALGMSDKEADALEWRGNYTATLMTQDSTGTGLKLLYGGYYTAITSYLFAYNMINDYGFYWTSTMDTTKNESAYYRKIFYNSSKVFRYSTNCDNKYSVRFVRDAQ